MTERQFAISGNWAVGADSLQWILYKRHSQARGGWTGTSFVHSTKAILERCMCAQGCPEQDRAVLLAGLPSTLDEWKATHESCPRAVSAPHGSVNAHARNLELLGDLHSLSG
jgi:hypothetical protein